MQARHGSRSLTRKEQTETKKKSKPGVVILGSTNSKTDSQLQAYSPAKKLNSQTPGSISTGDDLQMKKQAIHDVYR